MTRTLASLVCLLLAPGLATAQGAPAPPAPRPEQIEWHGVLGACDGAPSTVYCLMGSGFFRAPTTPDLDQVRNAWLAAHPAAAGRSVAITAPLTSRDPESRLVYLWVTDGADCLNVHLVARGCCPGGTMLVHDRSTLLVDAAEYDAFVERVRQAESEARAAQLGLWGAPERRIEEALASARSLSGEGRHEEALAQLLRVVELGGGDEAVWLSIAECHERAGRYAEALAAHDRAIGDGLRWGAILERARCVSRHEGPDAAVRWLEGLAGRWPTTDRTPHHLLGELHMREGRYEQAVASFSRAVEVASNHQGFAFDEAGWLILDEATLRKENNDFCELWPTLEYVARSCLRLRRMDDAFRFATMGVAIGQQLNRCKGYYDPARVEAGDVECRLVRAWVLMDRGDLTGAGAEIAHARAFAEWSRFQGWLDDVDRAERALRERAAEGQDSGSREQER